MRLLPIVVAAALLASCLAHAQGQPEQITFSDAADADPAVSPDGKHLAFASNRTGDFKIFIQTFGQSGVVQLTQGKKEDRFPAWGADNKTILFASRRTGNGDIYEATIGGSGFLQLTTTEEREEFPCYSSKDMSALLFVSGPKKLVPIRQEWTIVSMSKGNTPVDIGEGDQPRLDPNGNKILFVSKRTKNRDIWLMNRDGSLQTQLTTDPKEDITPCFSPDGKEIVFASSRTGNLDLWVMNADGSNQRQLTSDPAKEFQPVWSSGGYLYYTRESETGKSNIFRIKAP